jgi:L-fuconolactonase
VGVGRRGQALIVDAHIHFWRLARGDNSALSPLMAPLWRDQEPADLRPQLQVCGVDRIVVVQAAETLSENLYTLGLAARTPWIAGVVGWIDLASPSLVEEIAALRATGKLVGFRPVRDDNRSIAWMLDGRLTAGYRAMAEAGLTLDVLVQNPDELPLATHLAARHPALTIVLDHCGKPDIKGGRFEPWATDLAAVAQHPNVACKLSGLPNQAAPGAGAEVLRPYADHVLTQFGPARTLWSSDWPPLLLSSDYQAWWAMTRDLLAGLDESARRAVLGGTAARVYGLGERS